MRVIMIYNQTRPDTTGIYFQRACVRLGVATEHYALTDASRIDAEAGDLFLRVDHGDDYRVLLPPALRPSVFYAIDTHMRKSRPKIARLAPTFDLVFCAHRDAAERLGAEWLPVGCDLEFHGAASREIAWDVAFVGTPGGVPRKFYLQALRERYPRSRIGPADHRELGAIYSRAAIGFNYSIAGDVNMRVMEVLAAGAMLLTNPLPRADLERLGLRDGQHLVTYRNPEHLVTLLNYYLAHPAEREAIACAGAAVVRAQHTYDHRMRRMLDAAETLLQAAGAGR